MPKSILLIDPQQQHLDAVRQVIDRTHPDVQLYEEHPTSYEQIAEKVEWADYDLLLIDNELGDENALNWVRRFQSDQNFPPVIVLSSADKDSSMANYQLRVGRQLGTRGFIFREQLDSEVFTRCLSEALSVKRVQLREAALHMPSANEPVPPSTSALKNTYQEMEHARSLLRGHDHWPFSVKDLQSGRAEFAGYGIQRFLGRSDGVYTFEGASLSDQSSFVIKLIDQSSLPPGFQAEQAEHDMNDLLCWQHPHIARCLDAQLVDGQLMVVQELILGDSLSDRLHKTGVTRAQAVTYFLQLMRALSFLHLRGLRAGRFSPDNLFFRSRDELVLTHFRFTRALQKSSECKLHQARCNYHEALYVSPEMVQGEAYDYRSDLYIAGVILYYLVAGRPPFHEGSTRAILTDQLSTPAPMLRDRKNPLNDIIQGLMEKSPDQRTQTADDVLHTLDRLIQQGKLASL